MSDGGTAPTGTAPKVSGLWAALEVRASELDQIRRLFVASLLVGLALVTFFSGSNALFIDQVGADALPWVYLVNAALVVAAGLGYAAWSRRASTVTVLLSSIGVLAATVMLLWVWVSLSGGQAAAFALAVWFRFLFIFGFLGLWEVASAVFDVRQAKRLFPAIALGAMLAFMVGGAAVSFVASLIGTEQLILLSAIFFVLYGVAFRSAAAGADLERLDDAPPATPRDIISDRFSRDLALMRSITILLVFITEFVFYEQVEANFASDEGIARFLGLFLAGGTLAMVIVTATISSRFIARFGIGVGLATMPAGLLLSALVMGGYGLAFGIDRIFFVLAVVANVVNMVLANAIETPVGAVMYQPMSADKRMPVRVAVDGWLGSVALVVVGLLLLGFQALDTASVLPFVWLLAGVGVAGVVLARRLYQDYIDALGTATTLAFGSGGSSDMLAAVDEGHGLLHAGLMGDDPAAAFAIASLVQDLDDHPLRFVVPELIANTDDDVALVGVAAIGRSGDTAQVGRLLALVADAGRSSRLRASALDAVYRLDPDTARREARSFVDGPESGDLTAKALAIGLTAGEQRAGQRVVALANATDGDDRRAAARILREVPAGATLTPEVATALTGLLGDSGATIDALAATSGHITAPMADELVALGRDARNRRQVVSSLATGGTISIDSIEAVIDTLPQSYVEELVEQVYARNTRRPALLHRFVRPDAPSAVRRAGFAAIADADIDLPATVRRMLRDDVARADQIVGVYRDGNEIPELVALALADEFEATRRTIWTGLRLAGDSDRLVELEAIATSGTEDQRANAIEALDTLLPREMRDLIVPVVEPATIVDAAELAAASPDPQTLEQLHATSGLSESTIQLLDHHLSPEPEPAMSQTLERVLALKQIDIFSTLAYELLVELAEIVTDRTAQDGEQILTEGELGEELFALTDGQVQVGATDVMLAAGTVFGELAVLAPGPRSATVTAKGECTMLVLTRSTLLALADRHPAVMAEIARVLAVRLQNAAPLPHR